MKPIKRTAVVTGATGFLGAWIVKTWLARGWRVHGTVRSVLSRRAPYHATKRR